MAWRPCGIIWPIRGLGTVSEGCRIWSKVKVTLTILRRKQVLFSFLSGNLCRGKDVHLTQFWSILTKQSSGSGLCLCRLATTATRCSDFPASYWSFGACEGLSLVDDDTWDHCDRRWSNYLISIPLTLPVIPAECTVAHYHIFISLFSWEFPDWRLISPAQLTQIRGDCERSLRQVTFIPTI